MTDIARVSITLVKPWADYAWLLNTPLGVLDTLSEDDISRSMHLLAEKLSTLVDPKNLDGIIGEKGLTQMFLEVWTAKLQALNINTEQADPRMEVRASYATLATLPPLTLTSRPHTINLVSTDEDVDSVAALALEFHARFPTRPISPEQVVRELRAAVRMRQLWVCRADGKIVAYVLMGRLTPCTVAIRNVYVTPAYRKQGIAGAMVTGLSRWYLGAEPLGFDGAPSARPPGGVVKAVCLNVAEEHVARLYKRCGFLLAQSDRDPDTGVLTSYYSLWRTVKFS